MTFSSPLVSMLLLFALYSRLHRRVVYFFGSFAAAFLLFSAGTTSLREQSDRYRRNFETLPGAV